MTQVTQCVVSKVKDIVNEGAKKIIHLGRKTRGTDMGKKECQNKRYTVGLKNKQLPKRNCCMSYRAESLLKPLTLSFQRYRNQF